MVIVTGATGLLGSHLLLDLVKTNDQIIAGFQTAEKIKRIQALFQSIYPENHETYWSKIAWKKMDILSIDDLEDAIEPNSDVYHCAALVSFQRSDFSQLMKINREGTANVVNVCLDKGIRKLCYVSSTAAVGGGQEGVLTEKSKWKKNKKTSAYSISKYSAEKEVWRGIEEGLNAVMVNPSVILGAGNWNDSSLTIFKQVSKGLLFYPKGANATVDARDVSEIMIRLMESEICAERYLCIGSNQSFKDLLSTVALGMKKKPPSLAVSSSLLSFLGSLLQIITSITGHRFPLSKETINSSISVTEYDASKVKKELNFNFRSLSESVQYSIRHQIKQ